MDKLSACFKQVVLAQVLICLFSALIAFFWNGFEYAYSIMYGAALALTNTALSKRSIQKSSELAYKQPDLSMLPVFSGLVQRLVLFAAGFSIGILVLGVLPLPLLIGIAVLQLGYLACKMR